MDIAVDRKSQRYVWPLSELRAAGHEHKPIGLRATSAVESAGKTRPVFVPVRAWAPETSPTPAGRDPYHLVLVSGDETLKLFTSLTDRAGGSQALRWRDQEEPAAVWPPDYPIRVQVPRSERGPGFYHLVIKAQGRTSTSSLEIEFPHD
jgi:hypothetical protein